MKKFFACIGAFVLCLVFSPAPGQVSPDDFNRDPDKARIVHEDLDRFWVAWDMASKDPDRRREIFQEQYLDVGTIGLQKFVEHRIGDIDFLLAAIDAHPAYYASLRRLTGAVDAATTPARDAFHRLKRLFPGAVFPDTYIVMGRMNSGGTLDLAGLLVAFEMYGMDEETPAAELGAWHRTVIGSVDKLPVIIVHELVHFQQAVYAGVSFESHLLGQSIVEGAADFIAELVIGTHTNIPLHEWALPRERELWTEFSAVMNDADFNGWLYSGAVDAERPADLGYFIGYRIVQAYYERAEDKHDAIRDIIHMVDPVKFLEASGYTGS